MSINYQFSPCIPAGVVQLYPPLAAAGRVLVWFPAMAGQGSMSTLPQTRRRLEPSNSDISVKYSMTGPFNILFKVPTELLKQYGK